MPNQQLPSTGNSPTPQRIRRLKVFLGVTIATTIILLGAVGYLLYRSNRSQMQFQQQSTQYVVDSLNNSLRDKFNIELFELDKRLSLMPMSFAELRTQFADEPRTYEIGLTSKVGVPLSYITGDGELTKNELADLGNESRQMKARMPGLNAGGGGGRNYLRLSGHILDPKDSTLDLRDYINIAAPRDQFNTRACWAFSAAATYETTYLIHFKKQISVSPQYIINCSRAGTATNGGNTLQVYTWMVDHRTNLDEETHLPYEGVDDQDHCPKDPPASPFYAIYWALVDQHDNPDAIPTVDEIKTRLCQFGPISTSMTADKFFPAYKDGVIKGTWPNDSTNHAVQIIGWDDARHAWLCKNSYGQNWGATCGKGTARGYFWIDYKSFNIGRKAAWIVPVTRLN